MEYDNIVTQKRELEDIIANLERRKDLLFKENERLKAEWKQSSLSMANRSSTEGQGSVGSSSGQNGGHGSKLGLALSSSTGGLNFSNSAYNSKPKPVAAKPRASLIETSSQQLMGMKGIKNGPAGNLGQQRSSQNGLPPQPHKLQLQMQNNQL